MSECLKKKIEIFFLRAYRAFLMFITYYLYLQMHTYILKY